MTPELIALIAQLIPAVADGISEGAQLISRLQAGDEDAVQQAQDWLGTVSAVDNAIAAWQASKTKST